MLLTHNYFQEWDKLFTNGEKIDQSFFFSFVCAFLGGGGLCVCVHAKTYTKAQISILSAYT